MSATAIEIAALAVIFHQREAECAQASADLRAACREFRATHAGGHHIPRGTDLHAAMCRHAAVEFAAYAVAKNDEQTAKRRLDGAIKEYLKGGAR